MTDITLAPPPETGINDIVLRIAGTPLYTPNVFDRNVTGAVAVTASTSRHAAVARQAGTEASLDTQTSFLLTYARSLNEAVPRPVESTERTVAYGRGNADNCAALGLSAPRTTNVWRSGLIELMQSQEADPTTMFQRSVSDAVPAPYAAATFLLTFGRSASEQVLSDATATRVFDAVRSQLENVGLTDSAAGIRVFPRGAVDAVPATADEAAQRTAYQRVAAVQIGVLVAASRVVTVYYVPRQSTDALGQLLDARSTLDAAGLASTQTAAALDPALGGTVGPAAPMMGGYALALVDAPTQMEDG